MSAKAKPGGGLIADSVNLGKTFSALPIVRTDAGGFFGFGESEIPARTKMKGRFAQLLPTKVPDPANACPNCRKSFSV